jgi:ATP-binding cassette subfamily B protein
MRRHLPRLPRGVQARLRAIRRYFATTRPLLRLVWQASPRLFAASFGLMLIVGLLPVASIYVTSALLEALAEATGLERTPSALPGNFVLLLVLVAVANLLVQLAQQVSGAIHRLYSTRITNRVHSLIGQKAAEIDLAFFENPEFHNRMRTAANEASFRPLMFIDDLLMSGSTLTTFVSLATILLVWQPWVMLLILASSLGVLWVSARFGTAHVQLVQERAETERKKHYIYTMLTSDQAAKEIRLFGLRDHLVASFHKLLEKTYHQDRRLVLRELLYSAGAGALAAAVQPALVAFTALQAIQGAISIGQFNLYVQSIMQSSQQLSGLAGTLGELHESNLFASSLFGFLATEPVVEARRPGRESFPAFAIAPHLEFRNVSFRYLATSRAVLDEVSFQIRPGEVVALVGDNGAGKTSLVKLVAGLYEPTEGQILLDKVDIRTLDRDQLRACMSMIFQDYTVYHLSARENIGFGRASWLGDLERIEEAARRSGLHEVIARLPDGYDTVLGRFWEHGHELSGGQRQLVALARALLRDAPILILDEPTAALDVHAEQRFLRRLLESREGGRLKTVIFVSHRFTTVRHADRILVLDDGRLIEEGTHEQLVARDGHYAEMFRKQAVLYNSEQPPSTPSASRPVSTAEERTRGPDPAATG